MANDPRSGARRRRERQNQGGPTPPTGSSLGSGSNGPIPVVVEAGSPQFLNSLASSLGMDQGEGGQGPANSMSVILRSQQAVLQASKTIVDNMQRASDMISRFTQDQMKWAADMRTARQDEAAHMAQMLSMMTMAQMGGGGMAPGMGWGGPGGGGPGGMPLGGFPGYPIPPQPGSSSPRAGGGYSVVQGQTTLGNLRQRASTYLHQTMGAGAPGGPVLRAQYNAGGNLSHYTWTRNGRTMRVSPGSSRLPQLQRIVANRAMISNIAGGFAQGGMMGALRGTPYVGLAVAAGEAANDAAIWLTNQRAANAQYQSIYGGENFTVGGVMNGIGAFFGGSSDDRSGISQRIQEQGFVLQNRFGGGGMTEEMSRQAFQGVSQLGYNGQQRGSSLQFIAEEYEKLGMSVQESLELVRISAQHANSSLSGVAQGLDTVTRAAAATGQNAQMVRQSYISNYSASLGAAMGAGSGSLATALTMAGIGNNRDLAGLNFGQVFDNPGMMNLLAGQSGRTVGQIQASVANGDIRAFTRPLQQRLEQSMISSMNQRGRDDLRSLVGKYGGNSAVARSQGAQRAIVNELKASGNWNVYAMRQALANVVGDTSGMDDTQVGMAFVATLTGAGPDAQAQEAEGKNQITPLSKSDMVGSSGRSKFVNKFIGDNNGSVLGTWGGAITELFGGTSAARNEDRAVVTNSEAYSSYQSKTKSSNPAIEALLTKFGANTDVRVQVQTKQGPRVVTIDEAIKHFSDQISSGQAIVMNAGESSGLSLAEATGVRVGGFKPGQNGTVDSTLRDAPVGQSIEDWQKANPQKGTAGGPVGTVTVSPSPELRRLFNFTGTGGVNIEGAASAGRPPTPTTGPK